MQTIADNTSAEDLAGLASRGQADAPVCMNARVLAVMSNGQRRVAFEIGSRLGLLQISPPRSSSSGIRGHLWEQFVLPIRARCRLLWSPSTSAPLLRRRQVVTIHDIAFVDVPQFFSPAFARLYRLLTAVVVSRAAHIVAVSHFTRDRLIRHYGLDPDKVTCIHNGCSGAFFERAPAQVDRMRAAYGLQDAPYVVGFLGNDPRKNTGRLIEAWRAVKRQGIAGRLVLFGRASNPRVFAGGMSPQAGDSIVLAGAVSDDDLACLFTGARAFVFPSLYEGFGLPVVEAARCGARIVTSSVASLPEVSPPDSVLVDPYSADQIAAATRQMLEQPDSDAARVARIRWSQMFDWDVAAARYEALFSSVARA